jgi:hypothetical protein
MSLDVNELAHHAHAGEEEQRARQARRSGEVQGPSP